jgi:iron complex outermembrane receptor protein
LADFSLFYSKELKNINSKIDVLVAHSYQDFYTKMYYFAAYSQFPDSTIPNSIPTFATDKPEYILESYLGRVNFSFANKYLLTASVRRDASSKFSNDNRVGYFPSVALAWKLKEEFFKGINKVTDLKLRFGWGITGQQDINGDYYPALARYTKGSSSAQYQFGSQYYNVLRPTAYDITIKWETTTTNNLGLDFAFFNNRISGSIDVYKKNTKDLISNIPIAPGANFDISLRTNVGNIENKGVEFSLNTGIVRNKDWSWDFGFNIAYNENKITNLLKNQDPNFKGIPVSGLPFGTGNNIGKHTVGYAPYVFFMKKQVYNANGKPIEGLYEDLNRDGVVDDNDRYYYKKPAPDVLIGTSTQGSYKQWSFGLTGHGSFGGYLYNAVNAGNGNLSSIKTPSGVVGNAVRNYNETKFATNQSALSDYFLENASFYRLDNINIGYTVGKVFKNKGNLKLNASVQNVLVITKYKGLDPEVSLESGIDNNIYPRPRIIAFGLNLDF